MTLLHQRIHSSWLVMLLALASVIGIALAAAGTTHSFGAAWLVVTLALVIIGFINRTIASVAVIIAAGLLLGIWRGGLEQTGLRQYARYNNQVVALQGTLGEDVSYGPSGDQRLVLKDVAINSQRFTGRVWISTDASRNIRRGDQVTVKGKLGSGFGGLAASMFHASVATIIRPQPGDIGLQVRDTFADGIRRAIPEPEASLASGYLVGQRSSLPEELDAQLKTVGLTHAVVASGYNLTILVSLARQLLLGISKYLATLSAAGMIIGFIGLSGLSPSMSRAGLVTALSLAAWYYGRTFHPLVLLAIAAAATALANPFYVWGDIGWYLSFTSFAGVIIVAPLLKHALWGKDHRLGFMGQIILDTMSAQLATLPVMIFAFGHYSPYALLANLLVLPLIPLTMLLTFVAGTLGLLLPIVAHVAGWPALLILRYMTLVVGRIASLPGAQGDLTLNSLGLTASYVVLGLLTAGLWRWKQYDFRASEEAEPVD